MGILSWIVVGLIAGWLASKIVKGHGSGLAMDLIIGVVGALLGGWISGYLLKINISGFNITTLLIALGGSVLLLLIIKALRRR